MTEDRLLSVTELAEYLGVSELTCRDWNYRGGGPKVTRVGARTIRYRESDVERWIAESNAADADATAA